MKKVVNRDVHQVALQIHCALRSNSSRYSIDRRKSITHFSWIFRKDNLFAWMNLSVFSIVENRLSLLYICVKIIYVINCCCQFYLLSIFLSFSFPRFGYEWLSMIVTKVRTRLNNYPNESKWFPRVVMCDFMVRHIGSNQHWM